MATGIWDPVQRVSLESGNKGVTSSIKSTHSEPCNLSSMDTTSSLSSSVTNCTSINNNFTHLKIHDNGRLVVNSKLCDNINQDGNCKQRLALHTEAQKLNSETKKLKLINSSLNNHEKDLQLFKIDGKELQANNAGQSEEKTESHHKPLNYLCFKDKIIENQSQTNSSLSSNERKLFTVCSQSIKKSLQNQSSSQPMFEGKNIHFSAADNKPLCSYSGKLCKQRRVNGYAFCIRHILEDKSAPFKQCSHVAKYNNNKCTNPIPANEDRSYCNSHMQASGMAIKKDRKEKFQPITANTLTRSLSNSNSPTANKLSLSNQNSKTVSISVSSSPSLPLSTNTVKSSLTTSIGTIASSGTSKSYKITIPSSKEPSPTLQSLSSSSSGELIAPKVPELFNEKFKLIGREFDLIKMNNTNTNNNDNNNNNNNNDDNNSNNSNNSNNNDNHSSNNNNNNNSSSKLPINGKNNLTSINNSSLCENKKIDNTITISITSNPSLATSSHSQTSNMLNLTASKEGVSFKENKSKTESHGRKTCNRKRKKELSIRKSFSSKEFIYARKKIGNSSRDDIFHYQLYSSSSEDEENVVEEGEEKVEVEDEEEVDEDKEEELVEVEEEEEEVEEEEEEDEEMCIKPFPSITMSSFLSRYDFEISELRNQLLSQKWLLNNLIKFREFRLKKLASRTKRILNFNLKKHGKTYLDHLLEKRRARIDSKSFKSPLSIRKGICCFENEDFKCPQPSLPFTRHCRQHILYNVDQLLFARCTAKDSETSTQCCNSSLDVIKDEPLCNYHLQLKAKSETDKSLKKERSKSIVTNPIVNPTGKEKGKTQSLATSRPGRKSKKRRKMDEKDGSASLDSIDSASFLSQDSSDATLLNSSEKCDVTKVNMSSVELNLTNATSLPIKQLQSISVSPAISSSQSLRPSLAPERAAFDNVLINPTTSPSSNRLPTFIPPSSDGVEAGPSENVRLSIPASFDVDVPNLAPSDEALVASLVADLPPLGTETGPDPEPSSFVDADLTDVLNKIPDDAFNDLLLDNLKNGDTPSKEESEALEQALAMANKNVHYLSVAAAVVSSRTGQSTSSGGDTINGDTNYYSHPINGQASSSSSSTTSSADIQVRQSAPASYNLNENDILGLANNILGSLTSEQQQQLNGLIDGALASGSLTSSLSLKSALSHLNNMITSEQDHSDINSL